MAKTDPVYAIGECHSEVDGHPEKWLACVTISIHFRMVASDPYVVVVMDIGYIHQTPPKWLHLLPATHCLPLQMT